MNFQELFSQTTGTDFSQAVSSFIKQQEIVSNGYYSPLYDSVVTSRNILINFDIPGVIPSSVRVDFHNNKLEISGERENPFQENVNNVEIIYGKFKRRVTIPMCITNKENVEIEAKNGVLKIKIDKQGEERNRFTLQINEE